MDALILLYIYKYIHYMKRYMIICMINIKSSNVSKHVTCKYVYLDVVKNTIYNY